MDAIVSVSHEEESALSDVWRHLAETERLPLRSTASVRDVFLSLGAQVSLLSEHQWRELAPSCATYTDFRRIALSLKQEHVASHPTDAAVAFSSLQSAAETTCGVQNATFIPRHVVDGILSDFGVRLNDDATIDALRVRRASARAPGSRRASETTTSGALEGSHLSFDEILEIYDETQPAATKQPVASNRWTASIQSVAKASKSSMGASSLRRQSRIGPAVDASASARHITSLGVSAITSIRDSQQEATNFADEAVAAPLSYEEQEAEIEQLQQQLASIPVETLRAPSGKFPRAHLATNKFVREAFGEFYHSGLVRRNPPTVEETLQRIDRRRAQDVADRHSAAPRVRNITYCSDHPPFPAAPDRATIALQPLKRDGAKSTQSGYQPNFSRPRSTPVVPETTVRSHHVSSRPATPLSELTRTPSWRTDGLVTRNAAAARPPPETAISRRLQAAATAALLSRST